MNLAHLLMIDLSGPGLTADERAFLRERQPGGVCLFGRNVVDRFQVADFVAELRELAGEHLLVSVDQEGGGVVRITDLPHPPSAMALGAVDDVELTRAVAHATGNGLRTVGIDVDFAPVADVSVFIMRQFFLTIPDELEDAARIDGANHWQIYWRIMLPASGPALATLGTFTFMAFWNSFLYRLIITRSQEMRTLPVGPSVFRDTFTTEWTLLTAGLVMSLIPVVIAFLIGQRYFVRGITMTGIK